MPRANAADRARRMMALLPLLTPGAELPLADLAASLGATPAQIAADVATLSMCGLPPYSPDELVEAFVEDGAVHVFSAPPALDRPLRLTPAEAAALAAALEACGRAADDPLRLKLAEAASPPDAADLSWAVYAATTPGGLAEIHAIVASATSRHEALRIEYFSAGRGELTERVIEPWALGLDRGAWYVSAFCRRAGAERVFRLDRMHTIEPIGETFTPPANARTPVPAFPEDGAVRHAAVRFSGATDLSSREWPGALFREAEGDDTFADVPYASPAWVGRRVAARLGSAEVLEPAEVREEVTAAARRMLGELGEV
ncbi:MAG TPA: WYL domain-containing protein [Coriobacteriia bacterium]|jgi:proteasome accessory factor C